MSDKNQESSPRGTNLAVVVVIAAALLASLSLTRPVAESSRTDGGGRTAGAAPEQVDARLWQDPLSVKRPLEPDVDRLITALSGLGATRKPDSAPPQKPKVVDGASEKKAGKGQQSPQASERGPTHILAVLLPGGPSSEDKERRLRARRAVLGALQRWGYEPDDPNHLIIRPLTFGPALETENAGKKTSTEKGPKGRRVDVRTEAFTHRAADEISGDKKAVTNKEKQPGEKRADSETHVYVYWLSDDLMHGQSPDEYSVKVVEQVGDARNLKQMTRGELEAFQLAKVAEMLCREPIGPRDSTAQGGGAKEPQQKDSIQIIGPLDRNLAALTLQHLPKADKADSSSLYPAANPAIDKYFEIIQDQCKKVFSLPNGKIRLYVPFGDERMEDRPGRSKLFMPMVIAADDKVLATALIDELGRRGLELRRPTRRANPIGEEVASEVYRYSCVFDDHVALINEWDSDTSRDFRRTFAKEISSESTERYAELKERAVNVHGFSFIRGLDGRFAGDGAKAEAPRRDDDSAKSGGGQRKPEAAYERSANESQRDYLRRLGDEIAHRDEMLRLACGRSNIGIRAIGLLGSDFYDKLMILQTLKARFPRVIFFTTEMDARFLDHDFVPDTRNLIVASHYGLKLAPAIQRFITPFRDSTQTGLFLTTSVALANAVPDQSTRSVLEQVSQWRALPPTVFEIGLTRAHTLTAYSDIHRCVLPSGTDTFSFADYLLACEDLNPERQRIHGLAILRYMLGVGGIALLSYLAIRALLKPEARRQAAWVMVFLLLALALPVVVYASLSDSFDFWQQEPFAWVDGVSMWPSLWLSWLAMVTSAAAMVWGRQRIIQSITRTETEVLGFSPPGSGPFCRRRPHPILRGDWRAYRRYLRLWLRRARSGSGGAPRPAPAVPVDPTKYWIRYRGRVRTARQFADALWWTGAILIAIVALSIVFPPFLPIRGVLSRSIFVLVAGSTFTAFLVLLFVALSSAIQTRELAQKIAAAWSLWQAQDKERTLTKWRDEFLGGNYLKLPAGPSMDPPLGGSEAWVRDVNVKLPASPSMNLGLDHYLDIRLLAEASKGSQVMLYLPGLSLALILLARSPALDNWLAESMIALVLTIFSVVAVVAVLLGHWTGRAAREAALEGLRRAETMAEMARRTGELPVLREMRRQVETIREGIFSPAISSLVKTAGIPALSTLGAMGGMPLISQALDLLR